MKASDRLRTLLPQGARELLYQWHPGRGRRWRQHPGVERVTAGGHAVLTFDDGPDRDATPAVLDALDSVDARATFFVLGSQVEAQPELARELLSRGHEIGLHGFEHLRHDRTDAHVSRADIARGCSTIEDVLGIQCRWYRPPYGKMSAGAADACEQLGLTLVYWSAWGLDWEPVGPERIAEVTCDELDDGAIVLLHDSAKYARRDHAVATAQALPTIAARAAERGISLIALEGALPKTERAAA